MEAQSISTLAANGQIGEDEITSLGRAIQICDTGHRNTSQHGTCRDPRGSAGRDRASGLQRSIQKEVGIERESYICLARIVVRIGFENT